MAFRMCGRSSRFVSWNCGSASKHPVDILHLLLQLKPHVLVLQECKLTPATIGAFKHEMRAADYIFHPHPNSDLGAIVQRGINFAALQASEGDSSFSLARYGLLIGKARFLIRHQHGSPHSDLDRRLLAEHLATDHAGSLTIDIGDFNCRFQSTGGINAIWPDHFTCRRDGNLDEWHSSIDGAAVSDRLVQLASLLPVAPIAGAQHRPIGLQVATEVVLQPTYRWDKGQFGQSMPWTLHSIRAFDDAYARNDIAGAWNLWFAASSGPIPSIALKPSHGSWQAGCEEDNILNMFSKVRKLHSHQTLSSDRAAGEVLDQIAVAVSVASAAKLQSWREWVSTRIGAAKWIKGKWRIVANQLPTLLIKRA